MKQEYEEIVSNEIHLQLDCPDLALARHMTFKDFKFKSRLAYAISRAGFTEPSPIQEQSIPLILEGKDIVGQPIQELVKQLLLHCQFYK